MEVHDKQVKIEIAKMIILVLVLFFLVFAVVYLVKDFKEYAQNPINKYMEENNIEYMTCTTNLNERVIFAKEGSEVIYDWAIRDNQTFGEA